MGACYHAEIHFSDPVFPHLHGAAAPLMWEMLCNRGRDLKIEFRDVAADAQSGRATWDAWYTFSATGRAVHNRIEAEFHFRHGAIVRHIDRFPFWRWARQALGPAGLFFGWSGMVQRRVQAQAGAALEAYRVAAP